jgi:hypothetical protein
VRLVGWGPPEHGVQHGAGLAAQGGHRRGEVMATDVEFYPAARMGVRTTHGLRAKQEDSDRPP